MVKNWHPYPSAVPGVPLRAGRPVVGRGVGGAEHLPRLAAGRRARRAPAARQEALRAQATRSVQPHPAPGRKARLARLSRLARLTRLTHGSVAGHAEEEDGEDNPDSDQEQPGWAPAERPPPISRTLE